jgi:tetratricopeptide (TPR) repeat protein
MFVECPQCRQKLRAGWRRCPRCRMAIPQPPSESAAAATESATESSSESRWRIVAGMAVVSVLLWVGLNGTRSTETAAKKPRSLPMSRASVAVASGAGIVERGVAARYEAVESKRSGTTAYAQGDLAGALEAYEAAVAATPDDPAAHNNLAQVLVRQGRPNEALPHFNDAVRIDPGQWSYRFNRARAYGLLNRWSDAVAEYQEAARLFPEDHATQYNLGLALMRLKQYPDAVRALERAVAAAPEETCFLITLGTAYVGAEQHDAARKTFQKFVEVAPNDPEVARVKGLLDSMTAAGR